MIDINLNEQEKKQIEKINFNTFPKFKSYVTDIITKNFKTKKLSKRIYTECNNKIDNSKNPVELKENINYINVSQTDYLDVEYHLLENNFIESIELTGDEKKLY